jgi:hypothetical protein
LLSGISSTKSKNIKLVQTYWEEVWGKGNLKAVADFYDPNAKHDETSPIKAFHLKFSNYATSYFNY